MLFRAFPRGTFRRFRLTLDGMTALLALVLIITAVKQPATALRDGCSADDDVLATLDAGIQSQIRYSLSGESVPCYKVTVETGGKTLEGFLPPAAIAGLDEFEKGLRDASWPDPEKVIGAIRGRTADAFALAAHRSRTARPRRCWNRASRARRWNFSKTNCARKPILRCLHWLGSRHGVRTTRSGLSFIGRIRSTCSRIRIWKSCTGASRRKRAAIRARQSFMVCECCCATTRTWFRWKPRGRWSALSIRSSCAFRDTLGCTAEERLVAIVQSREAYHKTTDAAEWNGGQFDGRIRVPVAGGPGHGRATAADLRPRNHACLPFDDGHTGRLGSRKAWRRSCRATR